MSRDIIKNMVRGIKSEVKNTKNSVLFWNGLFVLISYIPGLFSLELLIQTQSIISLIVFGGFSLKSIIDPYDLDDSLKNLIFVHVSWISILLFVVILISVGIYDIILTPVIKTVKKFNSFLDK